MPYSDALDLAFRLQIFEGSPTSIPDIRLDSPKTHPRRCLDLGCSSGDWILAATRSWPNATFVGVDIVIGHQIPVHLFEESDNQNPRDPLASVANTNTFSNPEPQTLRARSNASLNHPVQPYSVTSPSPPLGARIQWVQANFLKPLPFGDGEFDYIHISGIARGVPEDKVRFLVDP
jgi:SAM-dependent methyltransferase